MIIAREQASQASNCKITEAQVQKSFHFLQKEGKRIGGVKPDEVTVENWLSEQEFSAYLDISNTRSRDAVLKNLQKVRQEWIQNPDSISGEAFHAWRFTSSLTAYTAARQHMEHPLSVAFDCDGVLYSFNETLKEWLLARGWNPEDLPDPTVYSLNDAWGLSSKTLHKEMPMALQSGLLWHTGEAFEDGVTAVNKLGLEGHKIIVNTARALPSLEQEAHAATITWLRSNNIHPDELHLANPFDPKDKLSVHFDVLFDDHAANVREAIAGGRKAWLIEREWNVNDVDVPRVPFEEVPNVVDNLAQPMLTK